MKQDIPWQLIKAHLKGEISDEDKSLLNRWLSYEENVDIYNSLTSVWNDVQAYSSMQEPNIEENWRKLSTRIAAKPTQNKRLKIRQLIGYAAVACVALGVLFLATKLFHPTGANNAIEFHTAENEKTQIILPDGSEVWLNENTHLVCQDDFNTNNRTIEVKKGEAFFSVVRNNIPFIVNTDNLTITVHGTKFNVNTLHNGNDISVSLIEGSVALNVDSEDYFLIPNQIATFSKESDDISIAQGDVSLESIWARDEITFNNESFDDLCKILSKWYNVSIEVDRSITEDYSYSFKLRDESLEDILAIMAKINPIKYSMIDENTVLISKK